MNLLYIRNFIHLSSHRKNSTKANKSSLPGFVIFTHMPLTPANTDLQQQYVAKNNKIILAGFNLLWPGIIPFIFSDKFNSDLTQRIFITSTF